MSERVRCKSCGSTRVSGITLGYVDGRLAVAADGRAYVTEGETVLHDAFDIAPGSVICENCGGADFRVEGSSAPSVGQGDE